VSTTMSVDAFIERPMGVVHDLLLNRDVLEQFARKQDLEPGSLIVEVDAGAGRSHVGWSRLVSDSLPTVVAKAVGDRYSIEFWLTPGVKGTIAVEAKGRATGRMNGDLLLQPEGDGTRVTVRGDITVHVPVVHGMLEKRARDHVLVPVLEQDLFPLLRTAQSE